MKPTAMMIAEIEAILARGWKIGRNTLAEDDNEYYYVQTDRERSFIMGYSLVAVLTEALSLSEAELNCDVEAILVEKQKDS